ncbi:hypothetical protein [Hymenobacter guriensis]|uniref:Uncharacterized protein n=1 Tax=Hymenobacter guriensis TaxID=2793065 RepID=A0ABS0L1J3_9BACT|nr:hypothetical protein [Hymenobacter guriensis]MBG8553987.1 hypothetical protein [Hymenobacter guriensis]
MQPSFEIIKQELARLHSFTTEIGKAQEVTDQVQAAAVAVIEAAEAIDQRQRELLEQLKAEHSSNIQAQSATLRTAAQQQATKAEELLHKELASLRDGAESTVKALQSVVEEQPRILSTIRAQHEQGVGAQTDLLRKTISESASKLNDQFGSQMDQLQKVKQDFTSSVGKQLDGLTAITDRLQVISASLTAFRDSMNAAKFSDRLESIESQQINILKSISEGQSHMLNRIQSLADMFEQRTGNLTGEIRSSSKTTLFIQIATIAGVAIAIAIMLFK